MKRRFTMIELLVVISIIGILTSILLPSLSKARDKVKATVCMNNQRSMGIAMTIYMSENNEFPPDDEGDYRWQRQLIDFHLEETFNSAGGYAFLDCPSGQALTAKYQTNIAANGRMVGGDEMRARSTANSTPLETMMLMDSYKVWVNIYPNYLNLNKLSLEGLPDIIARHQEKASVSYLDGSTRLKGISYLLERNSNTHTFWDLDQ